MFEYVDQHVNTRDWSKQALGVWIDNYSAITAYEKLGFVAMGEPQESTRKPGKFYQRMIRG
jgi:ribosomal protein S18 acetylase RimI-like enzyme